MGHICHISTTFNRRAANARRGMQILKAAVSQGHKVSLITGRVHDVTERDLPGVTIYIVPHLNKYLNLKSEILSLFTLIKVLRKIKPDIVHTYLAKAGILGRIAAWMSNVPHVIHTVHGPTFPPSLHPLVRSCYWFLEKVCSYFTNTYVFVGEELRQTYIKALICSNDNSVVIYTGRRKDELAGSSLSKNEKRLLRVELSGKNRSDFLMMIVGRIVPSKQHEHAIMVLEQLRRIGVNADLAIVGSCLLEEEHTYETHLKEIIARLSLDDYVHFIGFRNDILDVMGVADVIIMTSKYEGLPNVAVESVIARTPLVTYPVSGVAEVIEPGKTGFIVPHGDMIKMVETLLTIYSDRRLAHQLKTVSNKLIYNKYHIETMINNKLDLYHIALPMAAKT